MQPDNQTDTIKHQTKFLQTSLQARLCPCQLSPTSPGDLQPQDICNIFTTEMLDLAYLHDKLNQQQHYLLLDIMID